MKRSVSCRSGSSSAPRSGRASRYESSLVDGPGGTLIYGDTFAQTGTLEAGATREFTVSVDLGELDGVSDVDSLVYPARVDLRSAGIQVAASTRRWCTSCETPEVPIELAWWAEFDAPDRDGPTGHGSPTPPSRPRSRPKGGSAQQVEALRTAVGRDDGMWRSTS